MDAAGLAARLEAVLARGRAAAEARMTSRVTVMRKTGDTTTDDAGYEVTEWAAVHVDLPFRSDAGGVSDGGSRGVNVGGVVFEDATGVGHMPASTIDLADGDLVLVTDGEWAGDVWRIVAALRYDQKTARRVPIVEDVRPEEWS